MDCGFAVSVWAGASPQGEDNGNFLAVTASRPSSLNNSKGPAARDVHIVFSGGRTFRATQRPSGALPSNEFVGSTPLRQTMVVCGDAGSCSAGSGDVWEDLFSSLLQVEETWDKATSLEGGELFEGQRARKQQQQLVDNPVSVVGAASHGTAAGLVNRDSDASSSELLKALGPLRSDYAKRVSAVLSARFWRRCQVDQQSCECFAAIASPSAAFSLVFHSEAFGLLFFCRDKLGLVSLLAMCLTNAPDKQLPSFVLATSAANFQSFGLSSCLEKGVKDQAIEVPVDGVWVLDLWAMAAAEALPFVSSFNSLGRSEEPEHCSASLLEFPNVFCVPWEQPSIIRTTHMWCCCAICENARKQFWKQCNSHWCRHLDACECPVAQETGHSLGALFGSKLGSADAPFVPPALDKEASSFDTQQERDLSCLSSAHVLRLLYKELFGAVARTIPEALRRISGTCGPPVGDTAPEAVFVGLLFSGGVDSTLLAGMVLRVLAAAMAQERQGALSGQANNGALFKEVVVVELVSVSFSAEAPDRLTALRSFQDLLGLLRSLGEPHEPQSCRNDAGVNPPCNGVALIGGWALELRLVAVDVANTDSANCRRQLLEVIYPKRSHMDFNIAAPLYFASRGIGYLLSPKFDKKDEWQLLLKEASLWKELLVRPLLRSRRGHCQQAKRTHHACTEDATTLGQAGEPEKALASGVGEQQEAKIECRVCRRQAKSGCAHAACKLCCAKLQAAAMQRTSLPHPHAQGCDEIHVGGQGRLKISELGIAVHTACPVHRKPRLLCSKEGTGEDCGTDACDEGLLRRGDPVAPFKSLSLLPCGVPLATSEAGKPFMAMQLADLREWCAQDERRWRCVDSVTGKRRLQTLRGPVALSISTYTVQSTVFLMGSGADEIFGGYGRHRTANLTKGLEALRREQILDLRRLWFRNMGRDCRALSAFGRWARVPFLDERLLNFVCCCVPFEHVVRPSADVRAVAEEAMRLLLTKAATPTHIVSEEALRCPSASIKQTELLERAEEPILIPANVSAALGRRGNAQEGPAAGSTDFCSGNKWLIRLCAAFCGLPFSAAAKKRAMQFGSRSAKVSNSEYFPSNRKARGDATLESCDEAPRI
ncbi:hypothetical protein, conserved [Eimeria brunetti]|uniref:Asparagine synthetase domain-containing protein n=1 Tax=Eimeria brunetti TaxID=51314 RepID=U6LCJ6_9EIME|nr:hypothetical protein, conserved [Eimeria brunetti]